MLLLSICKSSIQIFIRQSIFPVQYCIPQLSSENTQTIPMFFSINRRRPSSKMSNYTWRFNNSICEHYNLYKLRLQISVKSTLLIEKLQLYLLLLVFGFDIFNLITKVIKKIPISSKYKWSEFLFDFKLYWNFLIFSIFLMNMHYFNYIAL